ncbi:nucleotidyltransferase family protein [Kushneria marisflavi]|uniref:Uncharacterized protein n=1 Tax=Kushneria marisflavi TaxID=157779 RepID=A0A240ULS2_9GAMM|nr:nucleotidyltransferase family protein [Kushneria marisflavi]ART62065.1 hypothetical protein B9H00_02405 [Kushneria marisflavi]RKD87132.1 molybdenum cofactor cytidylyltransferase [Kushneria marisflavi]
MAEPRHDQRRKTPQVIGLVLAAGQSRRFGSDKRLASFNGQTLLAATAARLAPHVTAMAVMLRHGEPIEPFGLPFEAHIMHAPSSPIGMGTSLATAVSGLLASTEPRHLQCEALALMLGDMPEVRDETLSALMVHASGDIIVRPSHQGRAGHPVVFGRSFWPALAELDGDEGARSLLKRHALQVVTLDTSDPGILTDIDTPKDLSSLQ